MVNRCQWRRQCRQWRPRNRRPMTTTTCKCFSRIDFLCRIFFSVDCLKIGGRREEGEEEEEDEEEEEEEEEEEDGEEEEGGREDEEEEGEGEEETEEK